uniref:Uncharacterized protein n=2 Tax=Panagrolaimus sp. PS1159 TaxID=55785 RepID=A0AC35F930_9BILA
MFLAKHIELTREDILDTFTLPTNCHAVKIIISVDSNSFPSYHIIPEMFSKVEYLPSILQRSIPTKTATIGIYGNISVICHFKDGRYHFLDKWNGVYGKYMLISFAKEKPTFNEAAVEAL